MEVFNWPNFEFRFLRTDHTQPYGYAVTSIEQVVRPRRDAVESAIRVVTDHLNSSITLPGEPRWICIAAIQRLQTSDGVQTRDWFEELMS